jgi:ornithine cyclodeaminase/alanine dehydrogenase
VYDIYEKAADSLIADLGDGEHAGANIIKAASCEELVKNAPVFVTATVAKEGYNPVIMDSWVRGGKTILMCDGHTLFDDKLIKRADKYIVDSREQTEQFVGYGYYPFGYPPVHGETGEVAAGKVTGRENNDELIIANNFGMAVEDMFVVRALFDRALEKGIGVRLPL